ncbi:hypothetical protein ABPG74_021149 [Tetrahymena malaccensis]
MKNIVVFALCCALLLSFVESRKSLKGNAQTMDPVVEMSKLNDDGPAGDQNGVDVTHPELLAQVELQAKTGDTDWSVVSFWSHGNAGCDNTCTYYYGTILDYAPNGKRLCCLYYLYANPNNRNQWYPSCYPVDLRKYGCVPN